MNAITLADLGPLALDILLAVSVMGLLLADALMPPGGKKLLGYVAMAQLVVCLGASFILDLSGTALHGAYVGDGLALLFKRLFLVAGILAVLGSLAQVERDFKRRQGEYYELLLFSILGMSLLSGARDLIFLVVSFELMGIPLYVLASFSRAGKDVSPKPAEAGLKLYLVGAISSAISLYGLSLIFGITGSTAIADIGHTTSSPLLALGLAMVLAGFGFKIGVAPFHMWVPDTYEGTSTPFAGFLSVAPKAAGFVALIQVLIGGAHSLQKHWIPLVLILIVATVIIGNLMALRQSNIKRLLGFSGVAHVGFILMGLISVSTLESSSGGTSSGLSNLDPAAEGLATLMFYLIAYLVTNMGLFMVVEAVSVAHRTRDTGADSRKDVVVLDSIASFAGIARHTPWMGLAILLFMLSLAGIPFVVGFWAKVYLLLAAWNAGFQWLVIAAALLSVVGLFYYLQVVRAVYMAEPAQSSRIQVSPPLAACIALCLIATVGIGLYPAPFMDAARGAASDFMRPLSQAAAVR